MNLNQLLTPEMTAAITTLAGAAGLESLLGAVSNKFSKHQSVVLGTGSKICKALAVFFGGIGNGLDMVQDYGGKVEVSDNASGKVAT